MAWACVETRVSALVCHTNGLVTLIGHSKSSESRSRKPASPNDLGEERQVHTHDAIFKEDEAIEAEQPRGGRTQGSKWKGSGPVRRLATEAFVEIDQNRDVEDATASEASAQTGDQIRLGRRDLGC